MKTLADYREDYYWFSGKASDVARQLAFAGIAFLWIFRVTTDGGPVIPRDLVLPAVLFALALAFDLLQYISATVIWGWFKRSEEKKLKYPDDNPELSAPAWYNWPINSIFAVKLICVVLAYILLIAKVSRILLCP